MTPLSRAFEPAGVILSAAKDLVHLQRHGEELR